MTEDNEVEVFLPDWAEPLFEPSPYKSVRGGRSGGKSWAVARALLVQASTQGPLRVLCLREYQTSIRDSVHRVLSDQIRLLGLPFNIGQQEIRHANGSLFIFNGIKNDPNKVRSFEGIDRVWLEEAQSVSESSYRVLIPTIRKAGSEIWVTWNPDQKTDPTYKRFVTNPPPGTIEINTNWDCNPWISERSLADKDHDYMVDPDGADWVWGGNCRTISKAQVLHGKTSIYPFEPRPDWLGPYQGADWGFAQSPTVLVRLWIREYKLRGLTLRDLHVEHEAYGNGVDIDKTPALFSQIPDAAKYVTRADNARPETISHMKNHGFPRFKACKKGKGSVEDGVTHLRSFNKIVIHPRCTHTIQDSHLWKYKTDQLTGDVLPELIDGNDDCWDAARYALEPVMKSKALKIKPPVVEGEIKRKWNV